MLGGEKNQAGKIMNVLNAIKIKRWSGPVPTAVRSPLLRAAGLRGCRFNRNAMHEWFEATLLQMHFD